MGDDGKRHELRLSEYDLVSVDKSRSIQSIRDKNFDSMRAILTEFKKSGIKLPEWFAERTKTLHLWKSPTGMASLAIDWRAQRFDGDCEAYELLESWRRRDNHLARYERGMMDSFINRRKDNYRVWAKKLSEQYDVVSLEKMDLREYCELPEADETDEMSARLRDCRRMANISMLRQFLKEKMEVVEIDRAGTTEIHYGCGSVETIGKSLRHTCQKCGAEYDRDDNAALNILARGKVAKKERESLATVAVNAVSNDSGDVVKLTRKDRFAAARKAASEAKRDKVLG
jgi:hypothetical protein